MSNKDWKDLERRYAEIVGLAGAASLAGWDQETMMPPGGAPMRAQVLAALAGVIHEKKTDAGLVRLVGRLHTGRARLSPRERRALQLVKDEVDKARRIPGELARELALAESEGLEAWRGARARRDWKAFQPALEHMVRLKRRVAQLGAGKGPLYDALLDDFEPGATSAAIDPLLDELVAFSVPLLKKVRRSGRTVDTRVLTRPFPVAAQRAFSAAVVAAMGLDPARSRLDLSTHPFCSGMSPGDVRMTGRYDERDLRGGLFGAVHEAGHGLYEAQLPERRMLHPLGGAVSMALHESQSRLWENLVARGRPFWRYWYPRLRKLHPQLKAVPRDDFWRAINAVQPSFIRVEADELTYNLHIALRTRLERDLIEGRLDVADLPARWDDESHALLGLRPRHVAQGVLQDIHWAMGLFGYFPTYSLGNLYAAQFMEAARRDISGLDARIARGDLRTLGAWLADAIHGRGRTETAERVVRRVTGAPLGVEAFRRHITRRVKDVYGV